MGHLGRREARGTRKPGEASRVAGRQHERRAVGVEADRQLEGRPDGRRRLIRRQGLGGGR